MFDIDGVQLFFNTSFNQQRMDGCEISGGIAEECSFEGSNLTEAIMTEKVFLRCSFSDSTILTDADVDKAKFIDCTVNGEELTREWLEKKGMINLGSAEVRTENLDISFRSSFRNW